MTSPYRTLAVVRVPSRRAVCVWCKHVSLGDGSWSLPKCRARARAVPDPVRGTKVVDDFRDCELVRTDDNGDARDCVDFEPTLVTRALRAMGARR